MGKEHDLFHYVLRRGSEANARAWKICRAVFDKLDQWRILSAIAMPDHLHVLAAPADRDASVGDFAKWFKRWFNEAYRVSNCRPSVSDGDPRLGVGKKVVSIACLDQTTQLSEKWQYLRQNPIRAGLVANPDDSPYPFQFNENEL